MGRSELRITRDRLVELIEECGHEADSYNGRGMDDRYCVSVSTDSSPFGVLADLLDYAQDEEEMRALSELFRGTATDNMGLGCVIYWPRVRW